jgi:hypothetical protein
LERITKILNLGEKEMKKQTNKLYTTSLIALLILSMTVFALPFANAHTPAWTIPTYAYIVASPDPVGVGGTAFVVMWLNWPPPTAGGSGGDRWTGYTVTITKPDGTTESKGPFSSEATSAAFFLYTPTQIGTYTFNFKFPGQVASLYNPTSGEAGTASAFVNDTYLPSSASTTLVVQQDPVQKISEYPLPTSYWTRPIEGQNSNWYSIASNWLGWGSGQIVGGGGFGGGGIQPDGIAPNSPHIMWTKPLADGGIVGGSSTSFPGQAYYMGLSYEGRFANPLVIYGRLYYDTPLSDNPTLGPYKCVDLRTGETIWENINIAPSFAQLYSYESPNQHGVIGDGYLWQTSGTTWMAFDPRTSTNVFNITDVPSGTTVYGPNGEITRYRLSYNTTTNSGWLALWNNTAAPSETLGTSGTNAWQWRPVGKVVNASTAYSWNVTVAGLTGLAAPAILSIVPGDIIIGTSSALPAFSAFGSPDILTFWAISDKPATRGQLLWIKNYAAPPGNLTMAYMGAPNSGSLNVQVDSTNRVFFLTNKETMQWWGYDLDSGSLLWGPVGQFRAYQYYGVVSNPPAVGYVAYGNFYVTGYGGILYCFESRTGKLQWSYGNGGVGNSTSSGEETPWGNYPLYVSAIADGKIYLYSSEHSPNTPQYKDARVRCVDAKTGEELWTLMSWYAIGSFGESGSPIADGFLTYLNTYDMQIYTIGKGPSATTVTASPKVAASGSTILIEGTVTDQSPGGKVGTPAISDENMGKWMEYLYMQKPQPTDAKGVQVKLTAIDPNGNTVNIGSTTSDTDGKYGIMWTPQIEGKYTIVANFDGSNSYYGSHDSTSIGITAAQATPTETPTPTTTPTITPSATVTASPSPVPNTGSGLGTEIYIAIAAAVVIAIVAAAALLLRKRK